MLTVGKPSSCSWAAAKPLPVAATVQAAQKEEVKIKRIRYGVVCLLHPREVFWYQRYPGRAPACHLGHIPSSLCLLCFLQAGHLMAMRWDPESRSPGRECPSVVCLLRNHEATAQGCPLKAAGGRPLRKHVKKGTKKRESLSYAASGSPQMGSICLRFPDPKAQAVISPRWVGSVWVSPQMFSSIFAGLYTSVRSQGWLVSATFYSSL